MVIPATLPPVTGQHRDRALAAARRARAVELRTTELRTVGWTYQGIADELGYANRGAVHNIVATALKACTTEAVENLQHLEAARLDAVRQGLWARRAEERSVACHATHRGPDRGGAGGTSLLRPWRVSSLGFLSAPSETLQAITEEIVRFQMTGSIVPGFNRKAAQMAQAGIYALRTHHDDGVVPLVRQWGVFEVEGLVPDRERARERLADALAALDTQASRFEAQRAAAEAKRAARQPSTT